MCEHYHCVQLLYTTQHRTVLVIFPLILQTIIIAQTISTGGEGEVYVCNCSVHAKAIHNSTHTDGTSCTQYQVVPGSQTFRHSWRPAQTDRAGYQAPSPTLFYRFQQVLCTSTHNWSSHELNSLNNKNSSGDEIANVNFFYNIAHVEASAYAHWTSS